MYAVHRTGNTIHKNVHFHFSVDHFVFEKIPKRPTFYYAFFRCKTTSLWEPCYVLQSKCGLVRCGLPSNGHDKRSWFVF